VVQYRKKSYLGLLGCAGILIFTARAAISIVESLKFKFTIHEHFFSSLFILASSPHFNITSINLPR